MKYHVILQPRAIQNLDEQYQYIAKQNPQLATTWFNRFVAAFDGLA
jgi:plasmid stabilization system protein ParE